MARTAASASSRSPRAPSAKPPAARTARPAAKPKARGAKKTAPAAPKPASARTPAAAPTAPAASPRPATDAGAAARDKAAKKQGKAALRLVRDGFTMPEADFALLASLKSRALAAQRETKKSELLRAGLHALQALDDRALVAALNRLQPVKIGRPKKGG